MKTRFAHVVIGLPAANNDSNATFLHHVNNRRTTTKKRPLILLQEEGEKTLAMPDETINHENTTPSPRKKEDKKKKSNTNTPLIITSKETKSLKKQKQRASSSTFVKRGCKKGKKKKNGNTFTVAQRRNDAYKKKTPDNTWIPPKSIHHLIQEDHFHDPWRIVILCILLNKTQGKEVKKTISDFFTLVPDAKAATEVPRDEIKKLITPLGLQNVKTTSVINFSAGYLYDNWTHITQLYGVGKYAADAYAIFVTGQWKSIIPADHMLNKYWDYLHQTMD